MQEFIYGIEETRYATIAIHAENRKEADAMLRRMLDEAEILDDVPGIDIEPEVDVEYGLNEPDDDFDDDYDA